MPGRRRHDALRELGLFGLAYLVYFGVRAITEGTAATAVENAVELVRLEQRLGIAWEQAVQDAVVASGTLLDAANAVYIYGHWPVIVVGGVLLFRYRRRHYYHLRNAALLSGLAVAGAGRDGVRGDRDRQSLRRRRRRGRRHRPRRAARPAAREAPAGPSYTRSCVCVRA